MTLRAGWMLVVPLATGCLADWRPPSADLSGGTAWFLPPDASRPDAAYAYRWQVPDGVTRLSITAWGSGGGGSVVAPDDGVALGYRGGDGALVLAEVDVRGLDALVIVPGTGGLAGGAHGAGGWAYPLDVAARLSGGGPGAPISGLDLPVANAEIARAGCTPVDDDAPWRCTGAGAGGGWSGVFDGTDLDDVVPSRALVVAGGGGGAGAGGDGGDGGASGTLAETCGSAGTSFPGTGARPDAPGGSGVRAIVYAEPGRLGTFGAPLSGGSGGYHSPHMALVFSRGTVRGGGGGGGGWFGGGGGATALSNAPGCGGGGSSWAVNDFALFTTGGAPAESGPAGQDLGAGGLPGEPGLGGAVRLSW
jgi:hypothetical protein